MPAIIENALQIRYDDTSMGSFKKTSEEDIYEWNSIQHEGRIYTASKIVASFIAGKAGINHFLESYRWTNDNKELTSEDKKNFISVVISAASWILGTMAIAVGFDDDDKDPWRWRFENLVQNMTQDYNILDWLKALFQPTVVLGRMLKGGEGMVDMVLKGMIQGERIKSGPNKGRLRGSTQFRKNFPIFASTDEWDRLVIDYGGRN
jgi:hypothetical protein